MFARSKIIAWPITPGKRETMVCGTCLPPAIAPHESSILLRLAGYRTQFSRRVTDHKETLASEKTATEGWIMAWSIEQNYSETAKHAALPTSVEWRQGSSWCRIFSFGGGWRRERAGPSVR